MNTDKIGKKLFYNQRALFYKLFPEVRPMIKFIKDNGNKNLIGVEIGVRKGINAYSILKNLDIQKLYLIDPYLYQPFTYDMAKKKLKGLKRFEFIIKKSENALNDVPDNLDFIYIDGDHTSVSPTYYFFNDLYKWFPKVKNGGVFGGHDFFNLRSPDVTREVMSFVVDNNLKLQYKLSKQDWWVVKE